MITLSSSCTLNVISFTITLRPPVLKPDGWFNKCSSYMRRPWRRRSHCMKRIPLFSMSMNAGVAKVFRIWYSQPEAFQPPRCWPSCALSLPALLFSYIHLFHQYLLGLAKYVQMNKGRRCHFTSTFSISDWLLSRRSSTRQITISRDRVHISYQTIFIESMLAAQDSNTK